VRPLTRRLIFLLPLLAASAGRGQAAEPALKGYDPVAYFTGTGPARGDSAITLQFGGQTFQFQTARHREMFRETPERYAPQYGGHCAYAMSQRARMPADPSAFAVIEGKLYLFSKSSLVSRFQSEWQKLAADADRYWQSKGKP
jgi:YHS domain-containing protein